MYRIQKNSNHLLVEFLDDFDILMIQTIIRHETMLREYADMDDIWLIGNHRADINLSDLETMAQDFQCRCSSDAKRKKTAIVVDEGLTEAILQLWVKEAESRVPFEIQIFHTLEEAEAWLGVDSKAA
jgi:hypothetical protein